MPRDLLLPTVSDFQREADRGSVDFVQTEQPLHHKVALLGSTFASVAGAVASGSRDLLIARLDQLALVSVSWAEHLRKT